MKRWFCILVCALLLMAGGCGGGDKAGRTGSQSAGVKDVLTAGMAAAETTAAAPAEAAPGPVESTALPTAQASPEPEVLPAKTEGIDVDLTALSSTMVYSEVYAMMVAPEEYVGKTVKMNGLFDYYHDASTGNEYFSCVVQDATACCAQGIEFVLAGDHIYPDDYPQVGEEIVVIGVFDTYVEGAYTYCTLRNAALL